MDYLAKCIYYVIKVCESSSLSAGAIAFEGDFASMEGLSGFLAGVVQSMVKSVKNLIYTPKKSTAGMRNFTRVQDLCKRDIDLDFNGLKPLFMKVSRRNTSARHFECLVEAISAPLFRAIESHIGENPASNKMAFEVDYKKLFDLFGFYLEKYFKEQSDDEAKFKKFKRKELKSWFKQKYMSDNFKNFVSEILFRFDAAVIDPNFCMADRSGGADWAVCHTCQYKHFVANRSDMEAPSRGDSGGNSGANYHPVFFESHDSAACVIALKGAIKMSNRMNNFDSNSGRKNSPYKSFPVRTDFYADYLTIG